MVAGLMLDQLQPALRAEVRRIERAPDLGRGYLLARHVGDLLDHSHELDLQPPRQVEVVVVLEDVRDAALPRLAVDPDDRLVGAADVVRVDGQVGHLPKLLARFRVGLHALLDRVLVRARERGVDQLARIRMARVDRQLVARLHDPPDVVDIGDVKPRVHALAEQVHGQRDQVDVAGALAVSEQRALHALGAGHHG